jgi:Ser/Thr protein kinase RdoA (MazF antagonist)
MDDQQTYLLNGLLSRQFGLGRVVRFRPVTRGRQALAYEIYTAQEREYLVQLYPPAIAAAQLEAIAEKVNRLDKERFSVVPFVAAKGGSYAAEGPQGSHMMVSLAPAGSALEVAQYSEHDISQIGLRLGWMHRLLKEQFPELPSVAPLADRVEDLFQDAAGLPELSARERRDFGGLLAMPVERGWAHGDLQSAALLLDNDRQVRTIMDWALVHVGSPFEDLVDAFLALCTDETGRLVVPRGRALLEAYHSLRPIKGVAWTPVVATWCAQRLIDSAAGRRAVPWGFEGVLKKPESVATAMASCV